MRQGTSPLCKRLDSKTGVFEVVFDQKDFHRPADCSPGHE